MTSSEKFNHVPAAATRPLRDYTGYRHPILSVPCPTCRQSPGLPCTRPGGRRAFAMHVDRRRLLALMFLIDYADQARLVHTVSGWSIEPVKGAALP